MSYTSSNNMLTPHNNEYGIIREYSNSDDNSMEMYKIDFLSIDFLSYNSMLKTIPDPLVNRSIEEMHKDRTKICHLMDEAFSRKISQKTLNEQKIISNDEIQNNINQFKSRLFSFVHKSLHEDAIDFFKSQSFNDQKLMLDWITVLRFTDLNYLKKIFDFFINYPHQFDSCKIVLNSQQSLEDRKKLIDFIIMQEVYKK